MSIIEKPAFASFCRHYFAFFVACGYRSLDLAMLSCSNSLRVKNNITPRPSELLSWGICIQIQSYLQKAEVGNKSNVY